MVIAAKAMAVATAARNAIQPGPGMRRICSGSAVIGEVTSASRALVGASGR